MQIYQAFIKRILDIVFSGIAILVFFIPMLAITIIIKADDPGPALFKQKRIGKGEKLFTMYQFRSMKKYTGYSHAPDGKPRAVFDKIRPMAAEIIVG